MRRTAPLRMITGTDSHASVMKVLARFVQRETLHPQIELLMTPRAVRRCERRDWKWNISSTHVRRRDREIDEPNQSKNEGHTQNGNGRLSNTPRKLPVFASNVCTSIKVWWSIRTGNKERLWVDEENHAHFRS